MIAQYNRERSILSGDCTQKIYCPGLIFLKVLFDEARLYNLRLFDETRLYSLCFYKESEVINIKSLRSNNIYDDSYKSSSE